MSRYFIHVRGERSEWPAQVEERSVEAMREDGFEVFELVNTIPEWVVDAGMMTPWVWAQDLFNLPTRLWHKLRGHQ